MICHHRLLKKHIKWNRRSERLQISIYAMQNIPCECVTMTRWCIMFCNSSACHLSFVLSACTPWANCCTHNCRHDNIPHNNNNNNHHSSEHTIWFHLFVCFFVACFNSKTICFVMFVECFLVWWKVAEKRCRHTFFPRCSFFSAANLSKTQKRKTCCKQNCTAIVQSRYAHCCRACLMPKLYTNTHKQVRCDR